MVRITDVEVLRTTDRAFLIDHGGKEIWIPKSQCKVRGTATFVGRGEIITFDIPLWLARKKGLDCYP